MLHMGANTERDYIRLLTKAGLLVSSAAELPTLDAIVAAVNNARPPCRPPQQVSRAERHRERIAALRDEGMSLAQIYASLVRENPSFEISYASVRGICRTLTGSEGDPSAPASGVVPTAPANAAHAG